MKEKAGDTPGRVARVKVSTLLPGCEDLGKLKLSLRSNTYIYY